jgi:hypothetical protein
MLGDRDSARKLKAAIEFVRSYGVALVSERYSRGYIETFTRTRSATAE